jgi:hypothetical protein
MSGCPVTPPSYYAASQRISKQIQASASHFAERRCVQSASRSPD